MSGAGAHDPEVLGGFDKTAIEEVIPEAVDGDAGGEGIVFRDQPFGEVLAVEFLVARSLLENLGESGKDLLFFEGVFSTIEDVSVGVLLFLFHDEGGGSVATKAAQFIVQRLLGCDKLLGSRVNLIDEVIEESVILLLIPLVGRCGEKLIEPGLLGIAG